MASMQSLRAENCRNVAHFFRGLADEFELLDETALVSLAVLQQVDSSDWVGALAEFLSCFKGLTSLFVSSPNREHLNVRSIGNHGQTLQHLHVNMSNDDLICACPIGRTYTCLSNCHS
jgi:hypothetical protein